METKTVRVLLVEDNPVDALCLKNALDAVLGTNFAITHVETLAEAKARLGKGDFEVLVLDLGLPDSQGVETFLEAKKADPDVPVVVLSGLDNETLAINAVRKGAQDYLCKDHWDGPVLSRAINYAIERHRLLRKILGLNNPNGSKGDLVNKFMKLHDSAPLGAKEASLQPDLASFPHISELAPNEVSQLIHELQVRQIELEMQNEELRKAQQDLMEVSERYMDLYDFTPVGYLILDRNGVIQEANLTAAKLLDVYRQQLIKKPFAAFVLKEGRDTWYLYWKRMLKSEAKEACEIQLRGQMGNFPARLETVTVRDPQGKFSGLLRTVFWDITDRVKAEERKKQLTTFQALYDLAMAMTSDRDLDGTLSMVVEQARNLLRTDTAYIALQDENSRDIYMHTLSGIKTEAFKQMRLPLGTGLGGKVASTGRGFIVGDYFKEITSGVHSIVREEGVISGIAVPIRIGRMNLGVLYAFNRNQTAFSQSDLDTLSLLGNLAAMEIVRKRQEIDLCKAFESLEQKVRERTAELFKTNERLQDEAVQRKLAEHFLRESQERLDLALTGGNLGYWDWNIQNDYLTISSYWSDVLGYSLEETKPQIDSWKSLLHPDDAPQVLELFDANLAGRIPTYRAEYRLLAKSGEWKWVMSRAKVVQRDALGKPLRMAGIFVDITGRKQTEHALRHSEQRFRAIFEGAEEPIVLKDRALNYIQINPAFEKLVGVPAAEIVGKKYDDLCGREIADHIRNIERRVLRGETIEVEHAITIRGLPMRFFATRTPLRESSGEIVGILTILHDITDRQRHEVPRLPATDDYPSEVMRATLNEVRIVAKRTSTILLTGESGSGKDHLARYIHTHSDRANGPYFSINCAAIAPELAESELFGHERGAFTGAAGRKRGLLELAEGGTLLLNEIGELATRLQSKLLTFLDTRKFTRVGGEKEITVNARLIAATNRDLEQDVEAGRFRKDLYYRISVMTIELPPLRKRLEDLPILVPEILAMIREEMQIPEIPVIAPRVMDALRSYDWPGNVRELRNVLERASILSHGREIKLSHLGLQNTQASPSKEETASFSIPFPNGRSLNEMTDELKGLMVDEALRRSGGSREGAAKLLGISRHSLKHYMKRLKIHV